MLALDYSIDKLQQDLKQGIRIDKLLVDDKLSGFSAWGPTSASGEVKLHKLYLDQSLHGMGLGSRLLAHCEAQACKNGYRKIILQVNKHNNKAIKSYERNGYYREKTIVVNIGGGFVMDDHVMAKQLDTKN
jgi:ribosomal protein S18 acetylase RimI-like enzyme